MEKTPERRRRLDVLTQAERESAHLGEWGRWTATK